MPWAGEERLCDADWHVCMVVASSLNGKLCRRAMAEFRASIGELTCPDISREEIVNACGVDDFHDGVNYTRTACVIAVSKARDIFEPFLHQASRLWAAQRCSALACTRHGCAELASDDGLIVSDADTLRDLLRSLLTVYHRCFHLCDSGHL